MSEARRPLHSSLRPRAELASHSGWGSDPRAGACDRPLCHGPFHEGEWGAGFSLVAYFLGVSLGVSGPPRGWEPGPSFPAHLLLASPTHSGHACCPPGRRTGTAVIIAFPQFTDKERERVIMVLLMCYRSVPVLHSRPVRWVPLVRNLPKFTQLVSRSHNQQRGV